MAESLMLDTSFELVVGALLEKYQETSLKDRWQEATSFGAGARSSAFWIRDSGDVVNIVWLNSDGLRDITYRSDLEESMFNFLMLGSIVSIELRAAENVAHKLGLGVPGDLVVTVGLNSRQGQLYWVANTEDEVNQLHTFLPEVMQAFITAR